VQRSAILTAQLFGATALHNFVA